MVTHTSSGFLDASSLSRFAGSLVLARNDRSPRCAGNRSSLVVIARWQVVIRGCHEISRVTVNRRRLYGFPVRSRITTVEHPSRRSGSQGRSLHRLLSICKRNLASQQSDSCVHVALEPPLEGRRGRERTAERHSGRCLTSHRLAPWKYRRTHQRLLRLMYG